MRPLTNKPVGRGLRYGTVLAARSVQSSPSSRDNFIPGRRYFGWIVDTLNRHKAATAAVFAMGVKAGGALLMILIFTLAGRAMSADDFGRLAVWFNAVSLLAVAAVFGQDTLIMRSWGEYTGRGRYDVARSAYRFGWRVTAISALAFGGALLFAARFLYADVSWAMALACAAFLFTQTLLHYSSTSCRALVGFVVSEINRELTWRLVLLGAVAFAIFHGGVTPTQFFFGGVIGMLLSLAVQSLFVRSKLAGGPAAAPDDFDGVGWLTISRSMWLSAIVEAVSQYADVMLVAYFASPADAGAYFVAARIANIFMMVTTGLHTYSMTHCATLFFSNQSRKLQAILRSLAIVSLALLLPALIAIVAVGSDILMILGSRFQSAYPILIVLTLASFAKSVCGPASGILLTTGHERLYSWVVLIATGARLLLTAALASQFGGLGAAAGWAIGNVPLAICLALICRAVCGIDPSVAVIIPFWRREAAPSVTGAGT